MERKILRTKGHRWCELQIELKDGRLSICGSEGRIVSSRDAKKEAREYWESFFEENRDELGRMAIEYGKRTPKSAARFVLESDGDYHGLDTHGSVASGQILITESCGQIRESLAEWFPEVKPYLQYHLNDLHAECVHQEQRGETWTTHPSSVCPECGWKLGHGWNRRELPAEVAKWVESLKAAT